jgi:hypothetical protein
LPSAATADGHEYVAPNTDAYADEHAEPGTTVGAVRASDLGKCGKRDGQWEQPAEDGRGGGVERGSGVEHAAEQW